MANYLITEEQLNQIIGFVNEEEKITKGSAMRKIVSTLLSKGFDKEDVRSEEHTSELQSH